MFINKIILENFKSFPRIELPLTNINILIGHNSSGKSSILQSLLILKNSLTQTPRSPGLKLVSNSYDFDNLKFDYLFYCEYDQNEDVHFL